MEGLQHISPSWAKVLSSEFTKPYFTSLSKFVAKECKLATVYPDSSNVFQAFSKTDFENVKVVLLGQDPYHGAGQANGLCFSVNKGIKFPPSLRNIFRGLQSDLGKEIPLHGDLSDWAGQGVFLLNSTLTVREHEAGSHQNMGWEIFTDAVIEKLSARKGLVYMLWGNSAQNKAKRIDASANLVLNSPHPSPLSAYRGFFENNHFSMANDYLRKTGKKPISW